METKVNKEDARELNGFERETEYDVIFNGYGKPVVQY